MKEAILNPRGLKKALSGGLWFRKEDFLKIPPFAPGEPGLLLTPHGQFWGIAYFNPKSLITARLLSREKRPPDREFFKKRLKQCLEQRKGLYPQEEAFRLVHGEGDLLPGLTIDLYHQVAVIQLSTAGMERLKPYLLEALKLLLPLKGVILKNNFPARKEEGLPLYTEALGVSEGFEVTIDDLKFFVDPFEGQKTGFFLDQRENRRKICRYVQGKTVLDLFSYTGAFSLYAAQAGAAKVLAVDRSEKALEMAERNASLNRLSGKITLIKDEVEHFLTYAPEAEVIILDPPALIKKKKAYEKGKHRYRRLIQMSLQRLTKGGILLACSCSQFLPLEDLLKLCREEGTKLGREMQLLEIGLQAPDHPVYLPMPGTLYLKALFLRVI